LLFLQFSLMVIVILPVLQSAVMAWWWGASGRGVAAFACLGAAAILLFWFVALCMLTLIFELTGPHGGYLIERGDGRSGGSSFYWAAISMLLIYASVNVFVLRALRSRLARWLASERGRLMVTKPMAIDRNAVAVPSAKAAAHCLR
jgi:hypothetical protein